MASGLFVTGTDTNVGKTVVAAALMHRYRGSLCYWKPIQTGIEQDDDTNTVEIFGNCQSDEINPIGIRLPRPLSPHLSARLANTEIKLSTLLDQFRSLPPRNWIVEGAGGLLVPVNDREMMIDLIVELALPVLIVARSGLGTINHTLLSIAALRSRNLPIAGVVMVGPPSPENRAAIEQFGAVSVVGEMPLFDHLTAERLADWATTQLDQEQQLRRFFL